MNSAENNIIKTRKLSIGYRFKNKSITIADNLNIDLHKGKLVCLIGKNGIGKSTLLRTLTKVQPPLKGEILLNGFNLATTTTKELAKSMSLVLTEQLPESTLTVFELVALGRQPYTNWLGNLTKEDYTLIHTAFIQTNTHYLKHLKHYELSDGQLQKVLIARALAQSTELIVLDEPTSHLDMHQTIETFTLLKKIVNEQQKTIIISTHEINLALQLADELWIMTPEKFLTGETSQIVASDELNNLFDSSLVKFDSVFKQFKIIKP